MSQPSFIALHCWLGFVSCKAIVRGFHCNSRFVIFYPAHVHHMLERIGQGVSFNEALFGASM